jgi:uncharacterized protein with HEPN domain
VKRKSELRLADYLDHMAQAIERIQRYTDGMDGEAFARNSLVQDAVIRNLEIIGKRHGMSNVNIRNSLWLIRMFHGKTCI